MSEYKTKETVEKEKFSTGAQRNDATGKGKYVLVSPIALRRLAGVYERGSITHSARNWECGLPISRCLDSAIRHIYQYIEGLRDEDHLAQAAWNLCAAIHMEEMVERGRLPKELNDMPNYLPDNKPKEEKTVVTTDTAPTGVLLLSQYVGRDIFLPNGEIGCVMQLTGLDQGIMVDVRHQSDSVRRNYYFSSLDDLGHRILEEYGPASEGENGKSQKILVTEEGKRVLLQYGSDGACTMKEVE
jgi:hypothetical protein